MNETSNTNNATTAYEKAVRKLNELHFLPSQREQHEQNWQKNKHLNVPKMRQYASRLGISDDDMENLRVIHITGTKGKGSTSAYCESILRQHGYKTGFMSSPHLIEVRERFAVNGVPISMEKFSKYFWEIYNRLDETKAEHDGMMPDYYAFLTIMSVYVFLQENVDAYVMEVGIGGEYDTTNFMKKPYVCGVTSLGIDHVTRLGPTIDSIAWNKAGIFRQGVPAFTAPQPPEAMEVLAKRAAEIGCLLSVCPDFSTYGKDIRLGIAGSKQGINASLAIQLCNAWIKQHEGRYLNKVTVNGSCFSTDVPTAEAFPLPEQFLKGLADCRWTGRNQIVKEPGVTFYLDGAHTIESMQQLVEWFASASKEEKSKIKGNVVKILLLSLASGRNVDTVLRPLLDLQFDEVLFSPNFTYDDDGPDRCHLSFTKEQLTDRCLEDMKQWDKMLLECENSHSNGPANGETTDLQHTLHWARKTQMLPCIHESVQWIMKRRRENKGTVNSRCEKTCQHEQLENYSKDGKEEFPHLQVLATGSLRLVGGVLRVLKDKRY